VCSAISGEEQFNEFCKKSFRRDLALAARLDRQSNQVRNAGVAGDRGGGLHEDRSITPAWRPDRGKDAVCERDGEKRVMHAYFPVG
jgi:hypothetical protein